MADTNTVIREKLQEQLAKGWALLPTDPAAAEAQARFLLDLVPGLPDALLLSGRAMATQGRGGDAIRAFRAATESAPRAPQTWRALADLLFRVGDREGADAAFARLIETSIHEPRLRQAAEHIKANRIAEAERILKPFLKTHPNDVAALRMLAEAAGRIGRDAEVEALLRRAVELAPGFANARYNLAMVLYRQNRPEAALVEVARLLEAEPEQASYRNLKAAMLTRIGEYAAAIAEFEAVLDAEPAEARVWMTYGHTLKTVGRQADAIAAYRRGLDLLPTLGEAWWSLANLKTVSLTDTDVATIERALASPELVEEDALHLHFALGKALEDRTRYEPAFRAYAEGNRLRRAAVDYRPNETKAMVDRAVALYTPAFFAARAERGASDRDPIFVVGMPRSGSTLIEQILASHPDIEGTMELPDIQEIARQIAAGSAGRYPEEVAALDPARFRALGEAYLTRARSHRKQGRPFFVDKMPNNWAHIGLIHLILPNATIIDARRHPLGCCFSNYKQHFARGQLFTYSLDDVGRYYAEYVRMMAHYDAALPGRVHRVFYERMIEDTEVEVRRLLDHLRLPFDPACLRFHENARAVRTASSEQVRRPIFTEGLDQWRHFEPWLAPLKEVLGPVLDCYPEVPAEFGT